VTRDPIVPGNIRDRTGTAGILRRAIAQINRRFAGLRRDVLAIWDGVRTLEVNDASTMVRTIYAMTPEEMAATSQALQEALARWIASEREPAHSFWWSVYDTEASQAGAAQSVTNLSRLSPAYGAARSLQQVVFSAPYRNRVSMAQIKSYEHWTGLSAGMRSELSQIIGRAVVDGKNPRAVRTEIAERLGVSRAKAAQYAQTDITDTLRQARIAEAEHAEQEFGLRIGMLWTSALIPTTRPWHASRNGRVYSADQVRVFYGERGNRYNCHCATTECLLDEDGKPILTKRLRETMAGELATWRKRTGKP
jgi:uncharacterized protein with gpF-like domain